MLTSDKSASLLRIQAVMTTLRDLSRRTLKDIREGRHREAYALFFVGVTLTVLGLIGIVDDSVLLSTILLAISFLVFHTAAEGTARKPALDQVLRDRQDYG